MPFPVMLAAQAGSVALGALFNAIGDAVAAGDHEKAQALREEAKRRMESIKDPQIKQVVAEQLDKSAMDSVQTDPRLKDAQYQALKRLQEVGDSSGMDEQSRAALEEARQASMRQEQADRQAIMANASARGMRGSAAAISAQLQAQQNAADRQAQGSIQAAGDARARALNALAQSGNMAGNIRAQDFGEQAAKAKAADEISRWNAQTRQNVQTENNNNAFGTANFQMRKAEGVNAANADVAQGIEDSANRKKKLWSDIGEGVTKGATGYMSGMKANGGGLY